MSLTPVSVVYDHAVEKEYLAAGEGVLFLEDVQEGFVKDGLGINMELGAFISAVKALAGVPTLVELGNLLRKSARVMQ